jgi:predicted ABC-type sugar transport system permease subunit
MFWGSAQEDLQIMIWLIVISFIIGFFLFFFFKKRFLGFFIFSLLANLSVYATSKIGSFVFRVYDLRGLQHFAIQYWPIINLILFLILTVIFLKNVFKKKRR